MEFALAPIVGAMRPDRTPAWRDLLTHHASTAATTLRDHFATDPERGQTLVVEHDGLWFDYSKQHVTAETIELLAALADQRGLRDEIDAMFRGESINNTEHRPALHIALRTPVGTTITVNGADVVTEVHETLVRMQTFADRVREGHWKGSTGQTIRTVVNIGIGGSDLGPAMAYDALAAYRDPALDVRFVANVDGANLAEVVADLEPETTLFVVVSKSFGTQETLTNARAARRWLIDRIGRDDAVAQHFVAVSANTERVSEFGIDPANTFTMWDWVGGRYSLDSAVGLALMLAVGPATFRDLLAGFHNIDTHVRDAPWSENIPALMGLLNVWNVNFFGRTSRAVVPYSHALRRFPAYLQQLEMESNGKSVTRDGELVGWATGPVVWGTEGTNGQHAYFQLLHQGTEVVPVDFLAFATAHHAFADQQPLLLANCLAQGAALAFGRGADEVAASGVAAELVSHRTFPGNRPSSTLLASALTPYVLGQLIAAYEHSVFVQAVIWGINPFDQWGVELGKRVADDIVPALAADGGPSGPPALDSSTRALIDRVREIRNTAP